MLQILVVFPFFEINYGKTEGPEYEACMWPPTSLAGPKSLARMESKKVSESLGRRLTLQKLSEVFSVENNDEDEQLDVSRTSGPALTARRTFFYRDEASR